MTYHNGVGAVVLVVRLLSVLVASAVPAFADDLDIDYDAAIDFGRYKTFSVAEGRLSGGSPVLRNAATKQAIQDGIANGLAAKGLTATVDKPDLQVSFKFDAQRKMDSRAVAAGAQGRGRRIVKTPKSEGTLAIDMRDSTADVVVWRGVLVDDERDAERLAKKIDDMTKKLIAKYPPKRPN
jgi:hypothetical protein